MTSTEERPLTHVTCRCGYEFETRAVAGRTTCRACKKAVTVPKPEGLATRLAPARQPAVRETEEDTISSPGLGIAVGLVLVAWGCWAVWRWNNLRSQERETPSWPYLAGGLLSIAGGGAMVVYVGRRIAEQS